MRVLKRLRELRETNALSQVDLATKAGVPRQTIAYLEHGRPARPSTARKLAHALKVRPQALYEAPSA